jgi:hypothetical protein
MFIQPPGLERGAVRRGRELAVGALAGRPRLALELARHAGPQIAGGDVDDPVRQLDGGEHPLLPAEEALVLGLGVVRAGVDGHLDLVELVHPDDAAGVLAVGPELAAEARRPAGVTARPGGEVEDLVGVVPARGTSDVPTRYRSSSRSRYTSAACSPRNPVPSMISGESAPVGSST